MRMRRDTSPHLTLRSFWKQMPKVLWHTFNSAGLCCDRGFSFFQYVTLCMFRLVLNEQESDYIVTDRSDKHTSCLCKGKGPIWFICCASGRLWQTVWMWLCSSEYFILFLKGCLSKSSGNFVKLLKRSLSLQCHLVVTCVHNNHSASSFPFIYCFIIKADDFWINLVFDEGSEENNPAHLLFFCLHL